MAAKSAKHGWGTKFTGKTFAFAGKTWNVDQYKELVTSEGGNVVDDVSAKLDYLILGRARGKTAQEKEAEKLNAKSGAAIQVLSETDFLAMVAPSRDEAIAMLKGGLDDLEHWNRLTRLGQVPMPDLSHADLRGVKFAGRQVVLSAVTIDGADFGGADLSGCHFVQLNQVNLDGANLSGVTACQISDCTFRKANLTEARISQVTRCDFSGAILHRIAGYQVKMVDCIFRDADLTGAAFAHSKFSGMDFVSSTLKNSQLSYADFRSSQLAGVNLSGADLSNANLQSADLSKADLSDACLLDADLTAAIIDDADFSGANIAGANLHGLDARKAKGLDPNKATALRVVGPNIQDL
ncbi:MAG: pentapeptide repeat-containing protein [Planctomycetes bacterium]|nr:pentapeptide repeat-containing protein [Planctomycetota bacterium]